MEEEKQNRLKNIVTIYLNTIINGVLIFIIISVILFIISNTFFKITGVYLFIVAFIIVIFISPFFSKLNWGEKLLFKYELFLKKMVK